MVSNPKSPAIDLEKDGCPPTDELRATAEYRRKVVSLATGGYPRTVEFRLLA
jgi:hypothetical protein